MEIDLSKDDIKGLVKALRIADWVSNSKDPELASEDGEWTDLQQKLYKLAAEAGLHDVVCYDFGAGIYEEHPDFDIQIFEETLDIYDEEVFWNGLVDRLVMRSLEERYGPSVRQSIERDPMHKLEEREALGDRLRAIMEKDGIYALDLKHGWSMPKSLLDDPERSSGDPRLN